MGFFPGDRRDKKQKTTGRYVEHTHGRGIQFNWKSERRCSLRMHSHNRQYSVGTGCHVIASPFCFAGISIVFNKVDHLRTNLTELAKFVKDEKKSLHPQPSQLTVITIFRSMPTSRQTRPGSLRMPVGVVSRLSLNSPNRHSPHLPGFRRVQTRSM